MSSRATIFFSLKIKVGGRDKGALSYLDKFKVKKHCEIVIRSLQACLLVGKSRNCEVISFSDTAYIYMEWLHCVFSIPRCVGVDNVLLGIQKRLHVQNP